MKNDHSVNRLGIKDACRQNFARYLIKALDKLPELVNPLILDMGCGTGVPTLVLADRFDGKIYATDVDKESLQFLDQKIKHLGMDEKITIVEVSAFDIDTLGLMFDLILAEGLLNIIGFERGLRIVDKVLEKGGYFIIHDELADHDEKQLLMEEYGFTLKDYFILDEKVWYEEYVKCLEEKIKFFGHEKNTELFINEMNEIQMFKEKPEIFRSVYYVLRKEGITG